MSNAKRQKIVIQKASGDLQEYKESKLKQSLLNSGADMEVVHEILTTISGWVKNGMTTNQIYSRAFSILRKRQMMVSFKYKLKQAILQFGETGYPFEQLVGQLYEAKGFAVGVGQIVQGKCVQHEIDVVAINKTSELFFECKYSANRKKQLSIQTPLYVKARMDDVMEKRRSLSTHRDLTLFGGLVVNTRFSEDSIKYGECAGLKLISWNYPEGRALKDLIDEAEIYPVTLLNYLTLKEKRMLIESGVVICSQINSDPSVLNPLHLSPKKYDSLMQELKVICGLG
jgi:hypothetical protein